MRITKKQLEEQIKRRISEDAEQEMKKDVDWIRREILKAENFRKRFLGGRNLISYVSYYPTVNTFEGIRHTPVGQPSATINLYEDYLENDDPVNQLHKFIMDKYLKRDLPILHYEVVFNQDNPDAEKHKDGKSLGGSMKNFAGTMLDVTGFGDVNRVASGMADVLGFGKGKINIAEFKKDMYHAVYNFRLNMDDENENVSKYLHEIKSGQIRNVRDAEQLIEAMLLNVLSYHNELLSSYIYALKGQLKTPYKSYYQKSKNPN